MVVVRQYTLGRSLLTVPPVHASSSKAPKGKKPKLDVDLTGDSDDGGMAGAGVDAGAGGSEGTK